MTDVGTGDGVGVEIKVGSVSLSVVVKDVSVGEPAARSVSDAGEAGSEVERVAVDDVGVVDREVAAGLEVSVVGVAVAVTDVPPLPAVVGTGDSVGEVFRVGVGDAVTSGVVVSLETVTDDVVRSDSISSVSGFTAEPFATTKYESGEAFPGIRTVNSTDLFPP